MKRSWPLLTVLFLLTACGSSNNGDSSATAAASSPSAPSGGVVATTANGGYQMTTGLQGSSPYIYADYQFKENGCDTGEHRFSGPTAEVTLAQLCAGLQNSWQNHDCAADLRQAYWAQTCQ